MFKWLNKPLGKGKQKAKQLPTAESKDLTELGNASQQAPSDALRSLLERATADAEQIVVGIKKRAQIEAEAEATRIIAQAKLEVQEIKDRMAKLWESKSFELKEHEATLLSTSEAAVPPIETSTPTETELEPDTVSKEKVEEPVQLQEEATEVAEEATEVAEEAIDEFVGQRLLEEKQGRVEHEPAPVKLGNQSPYVGEVELVIPTSVELKLVAKFYNYLQTMPELKILHTSGSWDQGTTITVVLERPVPLIRLISKVPGVEVTPEQLEKDDVATGKSSLLLRGGEKKVRGRIKLVLKEA